MYKTDIHTHLSIVIYHNNPVIILLTWLWKSSWSMRTQNPSRYDMVEQVYRDYTANDLAASQNVTNGLGPLCY